MSGPVRVVHLVAKTHLDLGFTALAAEVEERYRTDFFPRAVSVASELRQRGGPERLVWTTGSWILWRALAAEAETGGHDLADAVSRGDLAWHAYPFTTHTELMDVPLARAGFAISHELEERFGRPPVTAAKVTDVPGHTRGIVPLLAEAGVTFLHVGVNPAWPIPEVPAVFRWRSPDGAEVTVAYQSGGYGGEVVVDGCDEVLAFLHTGDNLGPPTADGVIAAHARLRARFPGAEVRGSDLDAFARALVASGAEAALPVVTAEIGDPWIFGAGSDPQKLAAYRSCLRAWHSPRRSPCDPAVEAEADRLLLAVAEHTWGLDEKVAVDPAVRWDRAALAELRASEAGQRYEASWDEQRAYLRQARALRGASVLPPYHLGLEAGPQRLWAGPRSLDELVHAAPDAGWSAVRADSGPIVTEQVVLEVDRTTGAVNHLVDRRSSRVLADPDHPLGLLSYRTYDEGDYAELWSGLTPVPDDEWWAARDNGKPGADASGAASRAWLPKVAGAWVASPPGGSVVIRQHLRFGDRATQQFGAPPEAWLTWTVVDVRRSITVEVTWVDKPASRLPEATWCSFVPRVADPGGWVMSKLGQDVDPTDVVRRGGRSLHGVDEGGVRYAGPDGTLRILTPDAPLVAPGRPHLLDADPDVPDLRGGWHVLLHDNCWGTNFPMWNEGSASFRFTLELS